MTERILIVDNEPNFLRLISSTLTEEGYEVAVAEDGIHALNIMDNQVFDLVFSDLVMPEMDGLELMERIRSKYPSIPFIMISGASTVEQAVEAMKRGAYDFITKPFDLKQIRIIIRKALDYGALYRELDHLRKEVQERYQFHNIIGKSKKMQRLFDFVEQVADSSANILIEGESGTGKEMLARAIHYSSSRRDKPFFPIDCGSLTETLLESELFGHVKGAFTGATYARPGIFEAAHGGTVFLDEVGDTPLSTQSKLLRVIQEKELKPVGSDQIKKVDVRIICATNRDLKRAASQGSFRKDLYYRIATIPLVLPPLRERMEDIPVLVNHFIERYATMNKKKVKGITREALIILMEYRWPGNIRELEHVIERAVLITRGSMIKPKEIYLDHSYVNHEIGIDNPESLTNIMDKTEKEHIIKALERVNFNRSKAAKILRISRRTLYDKLEKYGILSNPVKNRQPNGNIDPT
ncbi:MAG: sigma-54-dependent transcriptional regulator [bacterium]